jgi:DNA-binding SARP family transcriptional activator/tetratricopeptide (TPR) repeat protein
MLSVLLLGRFNIRFDDTSITDIESPRLQSLLAYLILNRDSPQSRAHLAFLFWPDTTEDQARANLRNLLHTLRHTLPNADDYLVVSVQTIQWRSDSQFSLDVMDFEEALTEAEKISQKGEYVSIRKALEKAVAFYTGDLLPSCYDDWIITQREGLRQAYLSAMDQLVHILEEQREYQAAIRYGQQLLRYDSLQETTYRTLMRLHALNDDRASALHVFHTCNSVLQRELNVEPSATTREVYEHLLGPESKPSPKISTVTSIFQLVGRDKEWMQLLQSWHTVVLDSQPLVVLLSGEAGIGKTRLVEELTQWAARQGIVYVNTRCYAAEGELAFAPITAWLRAQPLVPMEDIWLAEVARLLPEVLIQRPDLPRPLALTETWQRQHFFEALAHAILGIRQPSLLVIDDLQWCDRETFEWLHYLIRYDRGAKILVLGTYRPEEIEENHPLIPFRQALRLDGIVTEVDLQPLNEIATLTLGNLISTEEISSTTAQHLYQETEGNPLFIVETVRSGLLTQVRELTRDSSSDSLPDDVKLPFKVQSVLERRLTQLSPSARELAGLAAIMGREFSFNLLVKTSGADGDTLVRELDELWQRRIIREHGIEGYDFSHDKLRDVAYKIMTGAKRKLFHRRIAQALESLHAADLDPTSHQIAVHYERAGMLEQALPYYLQSAKVARRVYANEEAVNLLRHGLGIEKRLAPSVCKDERINEVTAYMWEELGDIYDTQAELEQALQAYQKAQAGIPLVYKIWQSRLHRKIGIVMQDMGRNEEGLKACDRAEDALGNPPKIDDDIWWREWIEVQVDRIWAHYWQYQWPEIEALMLKLKPVVHTKGGLASRARLLTASCLMHLLKERYRVSDDTLATAYEAMAISQEWDDVKNKVDTQFELGFLHLWRREFGEAETYLKAALDLAKTSGIVQMQTLILTYLTILYRFLGQADEVMKYALLAQDCAKSNSMLGYLAAAWGNQAWFAWRRGDFSTAEQLGNEAMKIWIQWEFQWLALWPLTGITIAEGREENAWPYIQKMLDPHQQLQPERLNTALEAAVQARTEGEAEAASKHIKAAIDIAREMGYL